MVVVVVVVVSRLGCSAVATGHQHATRDQDQCPAQERPTVVVLTEVPANPVMDSSQSAACVLQDSPLSMSVL
jgi:hypothetical protein